ncbi:MAG: DUF3800 domain-containing protein [Coriobacteriales bacterium]|jgi:hypothetical protein|nr:DUF3800 domain-containing protein [Coriobacteriales bacterium]
MTNRQNISSAKTRNQPGSLAFIDDAGDPGFKFSDGSTRYFVIASVIFESQTQAATVSDAIRQYKVNKNWSKKFELKFNKLRKDFVMEVLEAVIPHDFRIRAIVVDKTKVINHQMRSKPDAFFNYVVKEVLARNNSLINAKVRLDGEAGKEYKRRTVAYFRKKINKVSYKIADFDYEDSKGNNLIQLADLIAGSIYRSKQTDLTDYSHYLEALKPHIDEI